MKTRAGYIGIGPEINKFVPAEDAYEYALRRMQKSPEDQREFVEWYFSGNWAYYEDLSESDTMRTAGRTENPPADI